MQKAKEVSAGKGGKILQLDKVSKSCTSCLSLSFPQWVFSCVYLDINN